MGWKRCARLRRRRPRPLLAHGAAFTTQNGDVLAYHVPRVRHWIQNQSFAHYPADSLHQSRCRSWRGIRSLICSCCPAVIASPACRNGRPSWGASSWPHRSRAGCRGRAAVPAAVACATVPMAVLQASNAQSDLVTSFWMLCFVRLLCERRPYRAADVVWMGAALALGIATKPTVLLSRRRSPRDYRAARVVRRVAPRSGRAARRRAVVSPAGAAQHPSQRAHVRLVLRPGCLRPSQRHDPAVVLRQAALSYPSINLWEGIALAARARPSC